MAHERFKNWTLEVPLSHNGLELSLAELQTYKEELLEQIDIFTERMAKLGVDFARERLLDYDAIDTWELFGSLDVRKGDAAYADSKWIIFTDNFYAQYVEFGTGPATVLGTTRKRDGKWFDPMTHPSGQGKYRTTGWTYNGIYTIGMPARPFMWDTWQHLKQEKIIKRVAKEVFG